MSVRLRQIMVWLEAGWRIEELVLRQSAYYTAAGRVCAFELVLSRDDRRCVVVLADEPAVQAFLRQQHLTVLDLA